MIYIEISEELTVGEIYTERQIYDLLCNAGTEITILCDSVVEFNESEIERFKVMGKYEIFIHQNENHSYCAPSQNTMVYVIEQS
ncbi:hypothetical protein COL21_12680 [Bacillus thuringiensis]|uniref:hypothetical protein n=1 Tax=Bacillus thuringiensis TaxID=1428 RepID=UPI000BF98AEB|nr:hypothetical protein [Bacillus thuringiensis]PFV97174.1 hypothetical protein COL21_12680 [Bacillus thuringiensis]